MTKLNLYNDLVARISSEVVGFNSIGHFYNQFKHGVSITYPCCFIDYSKIDWSDQQMGVQAGRHTITLYIGLDGTTTDAAVFALIDDMHEALHLYEEDYFTPFVRQEERQNTEYNNVILWEIDFETTVYDEAAHIKKALVEATVGLGITLPSVTATITDASVYGYYDGGITTTVEGGIPPYTYLWENGATSASLSNVTVGNYQVIVTDSRGWEIQGHFEVGGFNPRIVEPTMWLDPTNPRIRQRDVLEVDQPVKLVTDQGINYSIGPELITNGNFSSWTNDNPDGWTVLNEDANNYTTQVGNAARIVADDTVAHQINQQILTVGKVYKYSVTLTTMTDSIRMQTSSKRIVILDTVKTYEGHFLAIDTIFAIGRHGVSDATFTGVSVREVTGNHATQMVVSEMFGVSTLGGIEFLRGNDNALLSVLSDSSLESQVFSLFYVMKTDDYNATLNGGISKGNVFANILNFSFKTDFNGAANSTANGDGVTNVDSMSVAIGDNNLHVWEYRTGSSVVEIYKDGTLLQSIPRTVTINFSNHFNLTIGGRSGQTYGLTGEFGDIIYIPRAITTEERQYLTDGLKTKNGIP